MLRYDLKISFVQKQKRVELKLSSTLFLQYTLLIHFGFYLIELFVHIQIIIDTSQSY